MIAWLYDLTPRERRTMGACFGGWSLDALDVQIFSFVIPSLLALWKISTAQAGELGTITLLISAFGGWLAGALSDRWGRVRVCCRSPSSGALLFTFSCAGLRRTSPATVHLPCAARAWLWRRMGRRGGADRRGDSGQVPRPRGWVRADWLVRRLGRRGAPLHHPDRHSARGIRLARAVLDRYRTCRAGVLDPPLRRGTGDPAEPRGDHGLPAHLLGIEAAVSCDHMARFDDGRRGAGRQLRVGRLAADIF